MIFQGVVMANQIILDYYYIAEKCRDGVCALKVSFCCLKYVHVFCHNPDEHFTILF